MPARCRLCAAPLAHVVADLRATPLANAYLRADQLSAPELYYPLRVLVCAVCFLVQVETLVDPALLFSEYLYFSSFSDTLLASSQAYVEMIVQRLELRAGQQVIEIASNDGYLLQYFQGRGLAVLGVEPAANIARAALARGIPTVNTFFGTRSARDLIDRGQRPHLVIANNVLAHVPDLNDFVGGLRLLLEGGGTATVEFHHVLRLLEGRQFDQFYHEHFQYFSLTSARAAFAAHGLAVIDVEELPAQGGSLRVYVRDVALGEGPSERVEALLAREAQAGLLDVARYAAFEAEIRRVKLDLLSLLVEARRAGQSVVGYGAAAKGNTLLTTCGITADLIDYIADRSPHKQGHLLPGSRIPIVPPDRIAETRPDYVLVLAWNLRDEVMAQLSFIRDWGGRFIVPIPTPIVV